jgi:hypothetical protein
MRAAVWVAISLLTGIAAPRPLAAFMECNPNMSDDERLGSLCGEGVREAYDAILKLGILAGRARQCGWTEADDSKAVSRYISAMKDGGRRVQFQQGFDSMVYADTRANTYGVVDLVDLCGLGLKMQIERNASDARRRLRFGAAVELQVTPPGHSGR